MGQVHRDHIIREQIRLLQQELGEGEDDELLEYRAQIELRDLPEEVAEKLTKEVDRLAKQPSTSAEAALIRGYLDTCLEMPWGEEDRERTSVAAARKAENVLPRGGAFLLHELQAGLYEGEREIPRRKPSL